MIDSTHKRFLTASEIHKNVSHLASILAHDYAKSMTSSIAPPAIVLFGVLEASVPFTVDLVRELRRYLGDKDFRLIWVRPGEPMARELQLRDVPKSCYAIVVDTIRDSGATIRHVASSVKGYFPDAYVVQCHLIVKDGEDESRSYGNDAVLPNTFFATHCGYGVFLYGYGLDRQRGQDRWASRYLRRART